MKDIVKDIVSLGYYALQRINMNKSAVKEAVLLYHSIGEDGERIRKMVCQRSLFLQHMAYLRDINKINVTLTFDDGFGDFYDLVLPLVSQYKAKIIIFVTVGFIERRIEAGFFGSEVRGKRPLTWKQVREISDMGVEIGSHGITHANLAKLGRSQARREIAESKKIIEDAIGREVHGFAYPYGSRSSFNEYLMETVRESGYKTAYTNVMGHNDKHTDIYALKRIRIYGDDTMFRFPYKVKGAYNWIGLLDMS